jgi:pimeloyl-ACP methyl ester carboxylesterase
MAQPLHYREAGPADSPDVLVLVHGFPLDSRMWRPQLETPPPGWRVVAPDLPGFGGSAAVEGDLTMELAADRLALLLDSLDLRRVALGGLSMGGYVCMALLRRSPALVRSLLLFDTRAAADTEEVRRGRLQTASKVERAGTAEFIDAMLPRLLSLFTQRRNPEVEAEVRACMAAASPAAVAAALRGMAARPDSTPLLRSITVPTLVVVGADDEITPVPEVEMLARSIRGASLERIDDAGHLPNLEHPDAFNRVLRGFLGALV